MNSVVLTSFDSNLFLPLAARLRALPENPSSACTYRALFPEVEEGQSFSLPSQYAGDYEGSYTWDTVDDLPEVAVLEVTDEKICLGVTVEFALVNALLNLAVSSGADVVYRQEEENLPELEKGDRERREIAAEVFHMEYFHTEREAGFRHLA